MRTWYLFAGLVTFSTFFGCQVRDKSGSAVKAQGEQPDKATYQCDVSSAKFIQFMPKYGEVHYVNANGVDYKQHEDGLNFRYVTLESNPPQDKFTIMDDEGDVVGGWTALSTASTWETTYRGKTYKNCQKVTGSPAPNGGAYGGVSGAAANAKPADVQSARFDSSTDAIVMDVVYGGGCKEHKFRLKINKCFETMPVQCEAIVVDDTHDDYCEAIKSARVSVSRAEAGLRDDYFKGAAITIIGAKAGKKFSIVLP